MITYAGGHPEALPALVNGAVDGRPRDRLDLVLVFQRIHLVRRRSVLDNVCAGALGRLPTWSSLLGFPREVREEAVACLNRG